MQCKDIPTQPVIDFLSTLDRGGTWFWSEVYQPDNSVVRAMPEGVNSKLALAKMRKLIKAGLVEGCACGCRGDFRLPITRVDGS